jgi:hypothetical protein
MNKLFTKLYKDYQQFTVDFLKWYGTNNYDIDVKDIIKIQSIFSLPILEQYLADIKNIGINFDSGCIILYYYRPELNVNEILAKSDSGKLTYTLYKKFDMKELNYTEAYERVILKCIEFINEPF